ncbi:MAG: beta-lactamase family protein [Saprospiraceae bacterium]|nr:beta-lactamase family protein [Saprospiraceae bacterium]
MMNSLRLKLLIIVALGNLSVCVMAQQESLSIKMDALFEKIDQTKHPGFSLSIITNGNVSFRNSYGMANLENGTPFRESTVSDLGSVAKHITNFAILHLIKEKKLAFSDKLSTFFPTLINKSSGDITILQLMQHTSGLREIYSKLALQGGRMGHPIFQEDALQLVEMSEGQNFPSGSTFSYCNTGYMLLAEIIQKASNLSYEAYLNEKIFQPLGMSKSFVMDKQGEIFPDMANSYSPSNNQWATMYDNSTAFGQGGIYMSLDDIEKWFIHLTKAGEQGEQPIYSLLKKAVLTNGDTLNYALGIENDIFKNINFWQHTGSSAGYRTAFTWIPSTNQVILLKSNYSSFDAIKTTQKVMSILFSLPLENEMPKTASTTKATESSPMGIQDVQAWQGDYFCKEMDVRYSFQLLNNTLYCIHPIRGQAEVKKTSDGKYSAGPIFTSLRPITDKKGNITHIFMDTSDLIHLKFEKMK